MIPVIYDHALIPRYEHISAQKTELFFRGLPQPLWQVPPKVATYEELTWAHDKNFISGVLSGDETNGFGTYDPRVTDHCAWTVGAMRTAVSEALANRQAACAPVAGFHHAGWDFNGGYCTFNGLMVAAEWAWRCQQIRNILIIDLDAHYGNGTASILKHVNRGDRQLYHWTHGYDEIFSKGAWSQTSTVLRRLPLSLQTLGIQLVLYQAAADSHKDDPLGAGYMTTEQLGERDRLVFAACKAAQVPVAWCLAGGYQAMQTVLEVHWQTWRICQEVYAKRGVTQAAAQAPGDQLQSGP